MTTRNDVCYYGLHIGCLNANSPDCRTCAERLSHVVDQITHKKALGGVDEDNEYAHMVLTPRHGVVT